MQREKNGHRNHGHGGGPCQETVEFQPATIADQHVPKEPDAIDGGPKAEVSRRLEHASGHASLGRIVGEYEGYFNEARPHQGIGQRIPGKPPEVADVTKPIVVEPVLGGLHHD
jgi:hypothetical protein